MRQHQWCCHEPGWACLNVDGSVTPNSRAASIGGLIRDHLGNWISGFTKSIGISNVLRSKLWAIFNGLQVAWSHGIKILQVQSDSKQAIELICDPYASFIPPLSLEQSPSSTLGDK
ncbi:hypothetical protein V6N11_043155 [Hibiscus sabdariffa]|uniref:RNase H type-1 domain-containing protein n=1 Tax=Hibiscus sabdariffa TaxID=183260 RepID=A0ABR2QYM8_9ROSI